MTRTLLTALKLQSQEHFMLQLLLITCEMYSLYCTVCGMTSLHADAPRDLKLRTSNNGRVVVESVSRANVSFELEDAMQSAWIECSAAGNPEPSVRWQLDSDQPPNASDFSVNGSRLECDAASPLLFGGTHLVCEASNNISGQTKTARLAVRLAARLATRALSSSPFNQWSTSRFWTSDYTALSLLIVSVLIMSTAIALSCVFPNHKPRQIH